jgi:hypothetical protein
MFSAEMHSIKKYNPLNHRFLAYEGSIFSGAE